MLHHTAKPLYLHVGTILRWRHNSIKLYIHKLYSSKQPQPIEGHLYIFHVHLGTSSMPIDGIITEKKTYLFYIVKTSMYLYLLYIVKTSMYLYLL